MIVHRDYRSASDSIVKVFNNKIEFYNPGRLPDNITVEDLLSNNYKSCPRNKLIADFCKNLGLIEKYGSGIRRIIRYFETEDLPRPEFRNISDGFMVTIYGKDTKDVGKDVGKDVVENVVKDVVENVVENEWQILKLLTESSKISAKEIAAKTGFSERTIQRYLKALQGKKIIKRIGPAKGGRWEVMK
jgi:ATP-dependent DNA helicase RecG